MGADLIYNVTTVTINTANANLDGTGTISTLISAASSNAGSVVDTVRIQSEGAVSVGMIRFFIRSNSMASWTLLKEVMVPEVPDNDPPYPVWATTVDFRLCIEKDFEIGVSTQIAETFQVTVFGSDVMGWS